VVLLGGEEVHFMRKLSLLVVAAMTAAAQAQAPTGVSISSGEELLVRIAPEGAVTVVSRRPAGPMTPAETYSLADLAGAPVPPGATTLPPKFILKGQGPEPGPPPRAAIRLVLRDVAGKTPHDTLLAIGNGYEGALRYRAVMRRGERSAATDVCLVMPGKPGYEHWPYQIDRLDLTDVRLVPWKQEDGLTCE
jgi:hypothetical protein